MKTTRKKENLFGIWQALEAAYMYEMAVNGNQTPQIESIEDLSPENLEALKSVVSYVNSIPYSVPVRGEKIYDVFVKRKYKCFRVSKKKYLPRVPELMRRWEFVAQRINNFRRFVEKNQKQNTVEQHANR